MKKHHASSLDVTKPLTMKFTSRVELEGPIDGDDEMQEEKRSDNLKEVPINDVLDSTPRNHGNIQSYQSSPVSLQDMRSHTQRPCFRWVATSTPEAVNAAYRYNVFSQIDYGEIKNDLIMHLAEVKLSTMAESPEEAARVFTRRLPSNLFPQNSKAMAKASDEQSAVLALPTFKEELKRTMFPFLLTATCCDLGCFPLPPLLTQEMLQKAYSILRESKIDTANPFLIDPEDLIPPSSSYRMGIFSHRPYIGLCTMYPIGVMGVMQELYCIDYDSRQILPLRTLVKANNDYKKPCLLPHGRYNLFGLERILFSNAEPIVVTPDLWEFHDNYHNDGIAIISWYGAQYTLPKVDFSPLAGRTVMYVFNPGSFNGDCNACRQCMNQVMHLLQAQGCEVIIMANQSFAEPLICTLPNAFMASPAPMLV